MNSLPLRKFHERLTAHFGEVNRVEVVQHYGDPAAEHAALSASVGVLDLSFRSRLCLLGADRQKFLNGQVTNNVKDLKIGEGCYAALVNAKGKMQSDLNIYILENEILLDFEPGYSPSVTERLEKFIIADDVQVADAAPHYGLLSVQGPRAADVVTALAFEFPGIEDTPDRSGEASSALQPCSGTVSRSDSPSPGVRPPRPPPKEGETAGKGGGSWEGNEIVPHSGPAASPEEAGGGSACARFEPPSQLMNVVSRRDAALGEVYFMRLPRLGTSGFDLFVPAAALEFVAEQLVAAARRLGGCACGWQALEAARIEAGIPRFGIDMDETNLPPEAGIESRAVSYAKGCYIGQEVIARVRTYGQVAKSLRGLRLADDLTALPARGDKLFKDGREAGSITSALASPALQANIAMAYVRRECNQPGQTLDLHCDWGTSKVHVVNLPFRRE